MKKNSVAKPRHARLRSLAKINLWLHVLNRRADGYHELRTVFQTISLADELEIRFTPAARGELSVDSSIEIPGNLVARAARMLIDEEDLSGAFHIRLVKRIPMGAGLGGGSSNAAATLLAMPALAGMRISGERLHHFAARLGSDVPFFLYGGTALGVGRGDEIYPLPERGSRWGLLLTPGIHIGTGEAYAALGRELTLAPDSRNINSFQSFVWGIEEGLPETSFTGVCRNDFEEVVFRRHPRLSMLKSALIRAGAMPAMLSGSGSSLFGLFANRAEAGNAARSVPGEKIVVFRTVSRARYHSLWMNSLRGHILDSIWPPQSRYVE